MAFGRCQALCPNLGILSVTHFLLLWAYSHSLRWRNSPCFPLSLAWAPSWLHQPLSATPPGPLPPCCMPQGQLPQYHPHFRPFLSGCSTHAAPAWPQCFLESRRSPPLWSCPVWGSWFSFDFRSFCFNWNILKKKKKKAGGGGYHRIIKAPFCTLGHWVTKTQLQW